MEAVPKLLTMHPPHSLRTNSTANSDDSLIISHPSHHSPYIPRLEPNHINTMDWRNPDRSTMPSVPRTRMV